MALTDEQLKILGGSPAKKTGLNQAQMDILGGGASVEAPVQTPIETPSFQMPPAAQKALNERNPELAMFLTEQAAINAIEGDREGFGEKLWGSIEDVGERIGWEAKTRMGRLKKMFTQEDRKTSMTDTLPEIGQPMTMEGAGSFFPRPEIRKFGEEPKKGGMMPPSDMETMARIDLIKLSAESPEEAEEMYKSIPSVVSTFKDAKGNPAVLFDNGYLGQINAPGPSQADRESLQTKGMLFGLGSRVTGGGVFSQMMAAAGIQSGLEVASLAGGGEINPWEVAVAGTMEGLSIGLMKAVGKGLASIPPSARKSIKTWEDLEGKIDSKTFSDLRKVKEAEEGLNAPAIMSAQFTNRGQPDFKDLEKIRKATTDLKSAQKIANRIAEQDTFVSGEIADQVKRISPSVDPIVEGAKIARASSDNIFNKFDTYRRGEANKVFGEVFKKNNWVDLRSTRKIARRIAENESISGGEKEMIAKKVLRFMQRPTSAGPMDNLTMRGRLAQELKFEIDNLIKRRGETAVGSNAKKALIEMQEELISKIDTTNPGYIDANKKFADAMAEADDLENSFIGLVRGTDEAKFEKVNTLFRNSEISELKKFKGLLDAENPAAFHTLYKGWLSNKLGERSIEKSGDLFGTLFSKPKEFNKMIELAPSADIKKNLQWIRDYVQSAKSITLKRAGAEQGAFQVGAELARQGEVQGARSMSIKALEFIHDKVRAGDMADAVLNPKWAEQMKLIRSSKREAGIRIFSDLIRLIGKGAQAELSSQNITETPNQQETE